MRRSFPILVCFSFGMAMLVQFFVPSKLSTNAYNEITNWVQIIYAFALIVGVVGLLKYHFSRVSRRESGWIYNLVTVGSLMCTQNRAMERFSKFFCPHLPNSLSEGKSLVGRLLKARK